jgi:hypothetical protein
VKTINLTRGYVTIVDDEDYEYLSLKKWHSKPFGNGLAYACGKVWIPAEHKSKNVKMHRVILGITDPAIIVDHINRDGLDNRRVNLRVCSRTQNQANRVVSWGTSRYKGVAFDKKNENWEAYIGHQGKKIHLGKFDNEIDAARRYNEEALKLFGEFSMVNDV